MKSFTRNANSIRTNVEWVKELRRDYGYDAQRLAIEDLRTYLNVFMRNFVLSRQNPTFLANFSQEDISALSAEFVQDTLERISINDFKLLDSFRGSSSFLTWARAIAMNEARQEFRRSAWTKRVFISLDDFHNYFTDTLSTPESEVVSNVTFEEISKVIRNCLESLPETDQTLFKSFYLEEKDFEEIAKDSSTDKLSTEELKKKRNSLHLRLYRLRQKLRRCLEVAGYERDSLNLSPE